MQENSSPARWFEIALEQPFACFYQESFDGSTLRNAGFPDLPNFRNSDIRNSGIMEFRKSGILDIWNSGYLKFRNSEIPELRNSGIP